MSAIDKSETVPLATGRDDSGTSSSGWLSNQTRIERYAFDAHRIDILERRPDSHYRNWPVVYVLNNQRDLYVGETLSFVTRMRQHLESPTKQALREVASAARVIIDERFNKSACLDLESTLIQYFSGDGKYTILNANAGVQDTEYYQRPEYRVLFRLIFDLLRSEGLFDKSIGEIENSDLFKYSPFKHLNEGQAAAIEDIVDGLLQDIETGVDTTTVVQGDPGTGKTIVAIYLIKLLRDIVTFADTADSDEGDPRFTEFFVSDNAETLKGLRIGFVIPQQSLRETIRHLFKRVSGLRDIGVLSPFDVGKMDAPDSAEDPHPFDLLVVDEAHRLGQRANQASGVRNRDFHDINVRLFGDDDLRWTQLDWIRHQSHHQILMLDPLQSVRPADIPQAIQRAVVDTARRDAHYYSLHSQMRVRAGDGYTPYIHEVLAGAAERPQSFPGYDLRWFDHLAPMVEEIRRRDDEEGLARLVAGYAWEWHSKARPRDSGVFDIEIEGQRFCWNRVERDWINSPGSLDEVGSIHTVQGYDLNYAGVIIGPDLRYDEHAGRIVADVDHYFDKKGKENNRRLGITYGPDDILAFIRNIYAVLLTRGMRGTYVYVCDPALCQYLRPFFAADSQASGRAAS